MSRLDAALVAIRFAVGLWIMWSVRPARPWAVGGSPDPVSVVIPARNEEHAIGALLDSIGVREGDEVVVVDDHSSDRTAEVAEAHGARVCRASDPPPGWTGKTWACQVGADATSNAVLAFVDADVSFGVEGIEPVLALHAEAGGLVSVQPFHEPGRPVEHLAMIPNIVAYAGTGAGMPSGPTAGAFGPVLVTNRADLAKAGGHAAVSSSIVEDLALARRYRDTGQGVEVRAGRDVVSFRMYPAGFGALVDGFRKNLAGGFVGVRPAVAALVVVWITLLVQATGWLLSVSSDGRWPAAIALYVLTGAQVAWMARRLGSFSPLAWLAFPASLAVFLAVFVLSLFDLARGHTAWKGRRVSLRNQNPG